jgi:hypothetical protein
MYRYICGCVYIYICIHTRTHTHAHTVWHTAGIGGIASLAARVQRSKMHSSHTILCVQYLYLKYGSQILTMAGNGGIASAAAGS